MLLPRFAMILVLLSALVPMTLLADGPVDNNPDTVRPVPKPGIEVSEADRKELEAGLKKLGALLDELRPKTGFDRWDSTNQEAQDKHLLAWDHYADVAIFFRAVRVALEDHEFFDPKEIEAAKKLLDIGLVRAEQLKNHETPWLQQTGLVVRGYLSRIDWTPQPYGLVIPETVHIPQSNPRRIPQAKPHRLDIWFHGRGETLSEVNFITQRMANVGPISPPDTIVLHPYGRYCNANKFAGEVDTFEALQAVGRSYSLFPGNLEMLGDEFVPFPGRIAARGFSMGGAACWQFAVHYPNLWFAANPGAGFSETPEFLKFFQKETLDPPWWEEKLWRWYDCPGYVANLKNLNVVAYSGEDDIQKQAADLMEAAYETAGMKLLHLIGPKTGHSIHPDAAKEIEAKLAEWSQNSVVDNATKHAEFVTYSLIYPSGGWVLIDGMKEQWEEARVAAELKPGGTLSVTTKNVTVMNLFLDRLFQQPGQNPVFRSLVVDKQLVQKKAGGAFHLVLKDGEWRAHYFNVNAQYGKGGYRHIRSFDAHAVEPGKLDTPRKSLHKRRETCGPIDHAFMDSFIFVMPSGQSDLPEVQKWVDAEMNRAITQWRRQFRGDARIKVDNEIKDEDIRGANLVLWGDRKSNLLIDKIADKLPIQWSDAEITVGEQKFDAADHALIAIYPNPLNASKYVVLNSGFTYREYDYLNNARQTPKLPDWAVVDLRTPPNSRWPGKIVAADFFDEAWQLKPPRKP